MKPNQPGGVLSHALLKHRNNTMIGAYCGLLAHVHLCTTQGEVLLPSRSKRVWNAKTNELDAHPSTRVPLHALLHSLFIYVAGRLRRPISS